MVWGARTFLWVYIFVAYLLQSLSYIKNTVTFVDKQSARNPRKFESHGNYQPYGIGD